MGGMRRCSRGHFYDASIHRRCPSCGIPGLDVSPTRAPPVALDAAADDSPSLAVPRLSDPALGAMDVTAEVEAPARATEPALDVRDERTRMYRDRDGAAGGDPVVGWLVAIDGALRGRDYRVHAEGNSIGRDAGNRIVVDDGTGTISRQRHAVVYHDPNGDGTFHIAPGDGPLTRVNGRAIYQATRLQAYDVVSIGGTRLLFVPLCGDRFNWSFDDRTGSAPDVA